MPDDQDLPGLLKFKKCTHFLRCMKKPHPFSFVCDTFLSIYISIILEVCIIAGGGCYSLGEVLIPMWSKMMFREVPPQYIFASFCIKDPFRTVSRTQHNTYSALLFIQDVLPGPNFQTLCLGHCWNRFYSSLNQSSSIRNLTSCLFIHEASQSKSLIRHPQP